MNKSVEDQKDMLLHYTQTDPCSLENISSIIKSIHEIVKPVFYLDANITNAEVSAKSVCKSVNLNPLVDLPQRRNNSIYIKDPVGFLRYRRAYQTVPDGIVDLAVIDITEEYEPIGKLLACVEKVAHSRTLCVLFEYSNIDKSKTASSIVNKLMLAKLTQPNLNVKSMSCSDGVLYFISNFSASKSQMLFDAFSVRAENLIHHISKSILDQYAEIIPYKNLQEFRVDLLASRTGGPYSASSLQAQGVMSVDADPKPIKFTHRVTALRALDQNKPLPRDAGSWVGIDMRPPKLEINYYTNLLISPSNGLSRIGMFDQYNNLIDASLTPRYGYGKSDADPSIKSRGGNRFSIEGNYYDYDDVDLVRRMSHSNLIEEAIVLGFFDKEFGHFLTESLSRTWALSDAKFSDMPVILWAEGAKLKAHHLKSLSLLNIDESRLIIVDKPIEVKRAWIPSRGYRLFGAISPNMRVSWGKIRDNAVLECSDTGIRKVFLSRGDNPRRELINRLEVENIFRENGFEIIQPENISFVEQISLLGRSDLVAGCFGSQMHLSMFLKDGSSKFVIASEIFAFPDEAMISMVNGTDTTFFIQAAASADEDGLSASWKVDTEALRTSVSEWLLRYK